MISSSGPATIGGGPSGLPRLLAGLALTGLLGVGCAAAPATQEAAAPAGARVVKFREIPDGSCIDTERIPSRDGTVPLVDCAGKHKYKTYAATDLPADIRDGPFPGYETMSKFAGDFCDKEYLKIYDGVPGKDGRPVQFVMAPFEQIQWRPEEKRVICATTVHID
ncbi:septum formation family protein [Rhizohabitans arisaemae]|uniref:septum formation family protein n=1 Tax=Rhizohabitans arisaemae TaxID=2720610 RepID=UPI0024B043CB|nr:septum formation family protein [Rhizohabitans arisaemae]